ncbi:MAG TPA: feruloyl-CoA synthase [Blastocatellia bacterium]|nr:feruloyl-CoA synthase [Blastocatellia bacterium]
MLSTTGAEFVPVNFLPARVEAERRADGALVLRSPEPLGAYARCLGEYLERWAIDRPNLVFLAQRDGEGWRQLTYGQVRTLVRRIATDLLGRGLSAERPVAILSGNSIEHALLALAAMHVGVPVVPVSETYSLVSRDFKKLRAVFSLLTPALVLVDDGHRFAPALSALSDYDFELVAVHNGGGLERPARAFADLMGSEEARAVELAFGRLGPDTIAKFLLTSGSTGEPKAVINTHRMLCSNQQAHTQLWPFLAEEPPVIVDWLPWNHTMGGNYIFGAALSHGGTYHIDGGRPLPGLIEETVRNLRDVSPTVYYNVPRGFDALLPFLEADPELRRRFFARLKVMLYGGATLPSSLWERLNRAAEAELGRRVHLTAGYGSTETSPGVTLVHFETARPGVIGLPIPGVELKLVPVRDAGKYELCVKGPNVTPGYWRRDDLTAAAFDEEGFYKMGDAGRLVDVGDSTKGLEFAGRVAEQFKLTSGTWVHTGVLRVNAIAALAPAAQDVVVAGVNRDEVGFLVFPNFAGCRSLCPEFTEQTPPAELLADARVRERMREGLARLKAEGGGSSTYATRAIFLTEPPSIDAGEVTDKGYINQRAVLERRADLIEELYAPVPSARVICLTRDHEGPVDSGRQ